jgi:hypothetical protein
MRIEENTIRFEVPDGRSFRLSDCGTDHGFIADELRVDMETGR